MSTTNPSHQMIFHNRKSGSPDMADFHIFGMPFRWLHVMLPGILGIFFLVDLTLPLGVASGVPYVICVSMSASLGLRWVWGSALLSSFLVFAGLELSPPGGEEWKVLSNRGLALVAIWATMLATLRWLRTKNRLDRVNQTLEQQVEERTKNLESVNHALTRHILERERISNQLQANETLLALVIQGTSEGIWDWDLSQNILHCSPRFKELLGYKPEEFHDSLLNFHRHIHPLDIPRLNIAFQEHLAHQTSFDIELRIFTKIAEYRHFRMRGQTARNTDGQPVRMAGSLMDITSERLAAQRQNTQIAISHVLAEASDFEQAIPDILHTVCREMGWVVGSFWETDPANIRLHCSAIVDIGPSLHPLFVEESQRTSFVTGVGLPGRVWGNHCPAWIWDVTRDSNFPRAPYAKQEHLQGALAFPVQLGSDRLGVMEFFSPDPISANTEFLLAITVIGNQIGQFLQRKSVESQLVRNKEQLECTNQELLVARDQALAAAQAKSNFLTTMSHEMRTPLNGVIGLTEILLADDVSPDHQEILNTVVTCSTALLHLINDILDYSKMEADKLALECLDFNLRTIIEEVLDVLAPRAVSNHLEFTGLLDTSIPVELRGDPYRLRQILLNLIGNAIKFTQGGQVSLHVTPECLGDTTSHLRFEVTDTGIGIDPNHQKHLFQSFHQADSTMARKFGGTGLGLAISKQLVELMGGTIGVSSKPGSGSCFWCTIPFERQSSLRPDREPIPWKSLRVCLIEDSINTQEVLTHYLQSWGILCQSAPSAAEGLNVLKHALREGEPIDLLIVDASLQDMDPWTFAQTISMNPLFSSIRMILLTDLGARDIAHQSLRSGYQTYVMKPLHYQKLYNGIRDAMGNHFVHEVPAFSPGSTPLSITSVPMNHPQHSHILLVEDNEINQRVATRLLAKLHLQVDLAQNGQEALDTLQQRTYDVIFMDCQMPDIDGYDTTRIIRSREGEKDSSKMLKEKEGVSSDSSPPISRGSRMPIIALTANALPSDRQRCLEAGMDDFLTKPVSLSQFESMLQKWCPHLLNARCTGQSLHTTETNAQFPVLTIKVLNDLAGTEDTEFLRSVIEQFLVDLPRHAKSIGSAWVQREPGALRIAAHACKGSCRTIGATALAEVSYVLETIGQEGNFNKDSDSWRRWEEEKERTNQALLEYQQQISQTVTLSDFKP